MGIESALADFLNDVRCRDYRPFEMEIRPLMEKMAEFFLVQGVKIGGIYQHFKGPKYMVTGISRDVDAWTRFRVTYVQVDNVLHGGDRFLDEFLGMHESGVRSFVLIS